MRKLFGHGNNVQALAACGSILASAAESKTADLADIWLWDTQVCCHACGASVVTMLPCIGRVRLCQLRAYVANLTYCQPSASTLHKTAPDRQGLVCCMQTWACVGRLAAHTLSVTHLAFSNDGRHLLSGSRDRSFAVFRRQDNLQPGRDVYATCVTAFCTSILNTGTCCGLIYKLTMLHASC